MASSDRRHWLRRRLAKPLPLPAPPLAVPVRRRTMDPKRPRRLAMPMPASGTPDAAKMAGAEDVYLAEFAAVITNYGYDFLVELVQLDSVDEVDFTPTLILLDPPPPEHMPREPKTSRFPVDMEVPRHPVLDAEREDLRLLAALKACRADDFGLVLLKALADAATPAILVRPAALAGTVDTAAKVPGAITRTTTNPGSRLGLECNKNIGDPVRK
ncbi:hypothetical protein VTJ49DRAFT_1403 [Mycothermus thermophilus]|uniref:Uncharacterized protein n=1 Tax=Humicola insolens TaxID=85995 RepID=A0ABR3VCK8_HUMIN